MLFSVEYFFLTSPFILYFAILTFQEPHDCFECFNRLPYKRYSIFQYTKLERNHNLENRYGKGAITRFEELVRQDQKKAEAKKEQQLRASRRKTVVRASDGETQEEAEQKYSVYKQKMQGIFEEQERLKQAEE